MGRSIADRESSERHGTPSPWQPASGRREFRGSRLQLVDRGRDETATAHGNISVRQE